MGPRSRFLSDSSALLISASFVIVIVGNRWGSYVVSPVPGVYLADLLFAAGSLGGLIFAVVQRARFSKWVLLAYGVVGGYAIVLSLEILVVSSDDRYLALRDGAPFAYLLAVPFLAVVMAHIRSTSAIRVVRVVVPAALFGPLLVSIGLLKPVASNLLGSEHAQLFGYRTDLTGAAAAMGLVAWSAWVSLGMKRSLTMQIAIASVAGMTVGSRSGLTAVVAGILVASWFSGPWVRRVVVGLALAASLGMGIALAGSFPLSISERETTVEQDLEPVGEPWGAVPSRAARSVSGSEEPSQAEDTTIPTSQDTGLIARSGTVVARIDTWADVVKGLTRDGTWLVGGTAGSDYLYELCTGIPDAPEVVLAENLDPKCAVDDYGPEPVVRDPHNWILNIAVTHGVIGVVIFALALGVTLVRGRGSEIYPMAGWTIGFFLITGLTFLISAGYAMVPIAVGAGWIVSRTGVKTRSRSQATQNDLGIES